MSKNKRNKRGPASGLTISIPAYLSDPLPLDKAEESLFPYTKSIMIEDVKSKIESFNNSNHSHIIGSGRANSLTELGITSIKIIDLDFNKDKSLLLKISAYQTNLVDGYYFDSKDSCEHHFQSNDKLCIDTYHVILYPRIYTNIFKGKQVAYWHVFLYLDPLKEFRVLSKIARYIMEEIVGVPIRNIKSEKFFSDIRNTPEFTKVEISLNTFSDGEDTEPEYVTKYKFERKIKKSKVLTLYNVNPEDALKALDDTKEVVNCAKRVLRFETAEQRVYSAVQEWKNKVLSTFEDSFNYTIEVSSEDISSKKIFEVDFIKEKLQGLFAKYLIPNEYNA